MLIDHISTSIVGSAKFIDTRAKSMLLYVAIVSAIIPDILVLFYQPGSIDYLYHRRYTNSLFLMPIYSFVIAYIFSKFFNKQNISFYVIYIVSLANYFLHILFDWITPFGSPMLYPFSDTLYSLDILHSFDPVYLTISSIVFIYFIYVSIKKIDFSTKLIYAVIFLYILHMIVMSIFKIQTTQNFKTFLQDNYPNAKYEATIPKTYWRWRAIASVGDKYIVCNNNMNSATTHKKLTISSLPVSIQKDEYLIKFLEYARFPAVVKVSNNELYIYNLIYSSKSYRLTYKLDYSGSIVNKEISGFDLKDK